MILAMASAPFFVPILFQSVEQIIALEVRISQRNTAVPEKRKRLKPFIHKVKALCLLVPGARIELAQR
jgi:hypothetical protein